jgi:hypothetical protein
MTRCAANVQDISRRCMKEQASGPIFLFGTETWTVIRFFIDIIGLLSLPVFR